MLYPILTVIWYSLFNNVISTKDPVFTGFAHHIKIVKDPVFRAAFGHTVYFTVLSVVFHLLIGLVFALLLNSKINPLLRSLLRVAYILPWAFTAVVIAIVWRLILNPMGVMNYILRFFHIIQENMEFLGNSKIALNVVTVINIWAGYPFVMVSMMAGLQGIPNDMYEAATIDGASSWQQFRAVTIPFLLPIIMSTSLLDFIWTTQAFAAVWMTTGGGPGRTTEVLSTYTYKLAFNQYQYSAASAAAMLILIYSMILAFFYVKNQKNRL
ncbi:sugar ABC transporter permease [Spirochaetia bacterium]|nr:sugar ABC transporter permease [Spirochaetia bacterium]